MSFYNIISSEWDLKRRNLNGLIRKAKEIHIFIHADYFKVDHETSIPRHKVTIQYALEFVSKLPDDELPGLVTISTDPLIYQLAPRSWRHHYDN